MRETDVMFKTAVILFLCVCFFPGFLTVPGKAGAARIKDLAAVKGIRQNQLSGYGLVVGLDGTGDNSDLNFTKQALANMMEKMHIRINREELEVENVAAVMVTASIPPFARIGDRIDVIASSLGDAESLRGGVLLLTPLKGVDGKIYAIAQGPVTIGGGEEGHLQVARIADGATVEREIPFRLDGRKELTLSLFRADFTTAKRMTDTINAAIGEGVAETIDSSAIKLTIPEDMWKEGVAEFLADIEMLTVIPDTKARVVINEKTGTVVIGKDVTLSSVAVAHGNLSVTINQGQADEKQEKVMQIPGAATIGELVNGLNSIGAASDDLISILQSIKAAGALQAELEII